MMRSKNRCICRLMIDGIGEKWNPRTPYGMRGLKQASLLIAYCLSEWIVVLVSVGTLFTAGGLNMCFRALHGV